jgi:hypothetical protein
MGRHEQPTDYRPYFVIPHWTKEFNPDPPDNGTIRPLPSKVTSYLCSGIRATAFTPGTDLTVEVDLRNYGTGDSPSIAQVAVWWADPTTGFVVDPAKLIGIATVPVQPRGMETATTTPMTRRIPVSAPAHICLLARVTHQLDKAGATPNPAGDRHWAQRNLTAVTVQQGIPLIIPFIAGNPLATEAEFVLRARLVPRDHHRQLADVLRAEPIDADVRLAFGEGREFPRGEANPAHRIQLRRGAQRSISLRIETGAMPRRDQFIGIEILQQRGNDRPVGSLGVAILGE